MSGASGGSWRRLALLSLAVPVLTLASGRALSSAEPARGDPAARLLPAEEASDVWDLTIELDDGRWIVAQATISNLGPGDRMGVVVGHVLEPDGTAHEFHKARTAGSWRLSEDRRRMDLDAILLDQNGGHARLLVNKKRVDMDLQIDLGGERAWSDAFTGPEYGFDLLAMAAPVRGSLQLRDQPTREVSGRAVLTHRWMSALESSLVDKRVELFALRGESGLYFTEVTTPSGETRRWLVVARGGRVTASSEEIDARFRPGGPGGASPGLEIAAPTGSGHADLERVLLRDEPLSRVPWVMRWWLGRIIRPRFVWSEAPFEFHVQDPAGSGNLRLTGTGLVEVARFDARAAPAAGVADGWGER